MFSGAFEGSVERKPLSERSHQEQTLLESDYEPRKPSAFAIWWLLMLGSDQSSWKVPSRHRAGGVLLLQPQYLWVLIIVVKGGEYLGRSINYLG